MTGSKKNLDLTLEQKRKAIEPANRKIAVYRQCELLGLNAAIRLEYSDETDIVAVRKKLEDEVAEALAEEEGETDGAS